MVKNTKYFVMIFIKFKKYSKINDLKNIDSFD